MNKESLGKLIAEKRKEKKMTQKELATLLNVSTTTVSKWETGTNFPDMAICESLSSALGITLSELLTQTSETNNVLIDKQLEFLNEKSENVAIVNEKIVEVKTNIVKVNYILLCLIVLLVAVLFVVIYYYEAPSFSTIYAEDVVEETINNTEQKVYNLHVHVKGKIDKKDIEDYSDLIKTKWLEGIYISENPDIIHIYFYNHVYEYKNNNYIAEVVLLHP